MINPQRLDELWDFGDAAASVQRLRSAANEATGDDRTEYLTQVARSLGLQDRFDQARELLDGLVSDAPVVATRIALERGRVENSSGDVQQALPLFRAAADLAEQNGLEFLQIDALHMLAICDVDHEADWTARAVRLADASTDERIRRWLISLHNNHGWALYDAGDRDGAIVEFELTLELAEAIGSPTQQQYAREALEEARRG
jgi:tetratricopeptide (TPR) repeat protein